MKLEQATNIVVQYATEFGLQSIGVFIHSPEMGHMRTDCYMNVRNYLSSKRSQILASPRASELDILVNNNWSFKKDSISGQSEQEQKYILELFELINS